MQVVNSFLRARTLQVWSSLNADLLGEAGFYCCLRKKCVKTYMMEKRGKKGILRMTFGADCLRRFGLKR
ncbi:MAG: hypothetical protein GF383_14400 [Candidatus Lokiarchaeota archaeon]|nr:hypothetical protein [Candidatus Lokiarchaeota archaeon]MBD3342578.1 hypothetical protein [Candidatus Lokiarchaeota archaeon]